MAETYLQLTQKIEELKHKAEAMKSAELAGVIERIRVAIEAYGLTPDQLFGKIHASRAAKSSAKSALKSSAKTSPFSGAVRKLGSKARFKDEAGNTWSGRGPRPGWIKAALAAGKSIEEFAIGGANTVSRPMGKSVSKSTRPAKYKDEAGNTWSGRGPKPRWFKAAIEAGKTLDQLAV